MHTSYFSHYKGPGGISIAGKYPDWWSGREYKELAPKYWFFKKYKEDGDEAFYTEAYQQEVLAKLDPALVFLSLGWGSVLLCWEAPGKFCHRRLVADWIEKSLGIKVPELGVK